MLCCGVEYTTVETTLHRRYPEHTVGKTRKVKILSDKINENGRQKRKRRERNREQYQWEEDIYREKKGDSELKRDIEKGREIQK